MENSITCRTAEQAVLEKIRESKEAEFLAVYGRRRVGKTFLIRNFFAREIGFELTGVHGASRNQQLANFAFALSEARESGGNCPVPESWQEAFFELIRFLKSSHSKKKEKQVVFFDELPWLATARSGFLAALEHFWNSWASRHPHVILIVCGSAASWMINKVINDRGGLYNRVTRKLNLQPFSLGEMEMYLKSRKVEMERKHLMELYMVFGGIPHYLKEIEPGQSPAEVINSICFSQHALLADEFPKLFASLFKNHHLHEKIVRALGGRRKGMTREELVRRTGIGSGGGLTSALTELEHSGFIRFSQPFGNLNKQGLYRLIDEFSLFHLVWMGKRRPSDWVKLHTSQAWKSWSGYSFEALALKHIRQIKDALQIGAVDTFESSWAWVPSDPDKTGVQIDLLIDRRDDCINLCEMKFSSEPFVITKAIANTLITKRDLFKEKTKTSKTLFFTLVTPFGVTQNKWYDILVPQCITAKSLFLTPHQN